MRLIDADAYKATMRDVNGVYWEDILDNMMPTVDAVPVRHGRWIYGNEFHWYTASCNQCGYKRTTDIKATNWNGWKYCPMCGTRMDKE